jgi:hypothetical protein
MKITELRPCDLCQGPINGQDRGVQFFVVRVSTAIIDAGAVNRHLGLAQMLGSDQLAHVVGPNEDAATIVADQGDGEWNELHVCMDCWAKHLYLLSSAIEDRSKDERSGTGG